MELITTSKGGLKLCFEGFMYTKAYTRKTKVWWKCSKKTSLGCRATLSTVQDHTNPVPGQPHNHQADETDVVYVKHRKNMRDQAASSLGKPSQIFAQTVSQMPPEVLSFLPTEENVKRSLRYQRRTPPVPQNLSEFVIPDEWTTTAGVNQEPFLLYDNGPDSNSRVIAFATEADLRRLSAADTVFMDGNFAMAPKLFSQLNVLRVPFGETSVTCVYALLQHKTRAAYDELLQAIVDKYEAIGLVMNVQTIITDFEEAVLRAVAGVFGRDVNSKGCFYHLTQSTWRKIQSLGLAQHYKSNEDFRQFCGMLDGLAFLPHADVQQGIEYLKTIAPAEATDLVAYFDKTYVSGTFRLLPGDNNIIRVRHVQPLYPPVVWSVHEATLNDSPRTNNVCEGWNNKFLNLVGHYHPSVWKLIQWFQKENATVRTVIQQDAVGNPPKRRVKKGLERLQHRLRTLCEQYNSGNKTLPEFLEGVGHNIRINKHYEINE